MVRLLVPVYLFLIIGTPAGLVGALWIVSEHFWVRLAVLSAAPLLYAILYVGIAGLLSLPHHKAIVPGVFPVDLSDPVYSRRKLYGLCWTSVYYFTPIYFLFLSIPFLKKILFRLFGYRGGLDFTVYPDTWIRDLPLLNFGRGAYLSNRATIGTNIILTNGHILVDGITVDEGGLVGHGARGPRWKKGKNWRWMCPRSQDRCKRRGRSRSLCTLGARHNHRRRCKSRSCIANRVRFNRWS